jgi:hypothetical protein
LKKNGKNYRFAGNSTLVLNHGEGFLHPSPEQRPVLIKQYHERAHQGALTVLNNLKLRHFWPKMGVEVASCPCARGNSRIPQKTTLRSPTLPWTPFSHLEMDLAGELPTTSHGNRWILVVQDYVTKYVLLFLHC